MSRIYNWVACRDAFEPTYTAEELWANPLPMPDVITVLPIQDSLSSNQTPGIGIDVSVLWEPSPLKEERVLQDTACVTVNGKPLLNTSVSWFPTGVPILQPDGNYDHIIAGISIHPDFSHLEPGLHVATIRFESVTGTEHTHQWAFEVTR